jgi:putative FmdB family regulatory protein
MPIYEYRCLACGHTLDALQKLSDAPLEDCPECEEAALKRLMSAPAFRLKGGGWYETDFKSDKEKRRNLAERSGEASKSESGDAAKANGSSSTVDAKASKDGKPSGDAKASDGKSTTTESKGAAKDSPKESASKSARKHTERPPGT